ncbi:hypothetical protein GCM10018962_36460 [Dactylosporangium matsuzakiense]|uniref:Uncharacterized protein n=1 Tax=Dactylosporangium matsuzakiense TaxID=53360 RepID=A0A9W6KXU8_9ACTN|nr:hypothetical protein GCM10017581_103230 [Dactylosporangium matsuzakiense]
MAAVAVFGLAATAGCSGPPGAELVSSRVEGYTNLIWLGDWVYYRASYEDSDSGTPFKRVPAAGGSAQEVPVDGLGDCMNKYLGSAEPDRVVAISDHELGLEYDCYTRDSSRPVYVRWDAARERSTLVDRPFSRTVSTTAAVFSAEAADGSTVYLTDHCGTDAAEPAATRAVCRQDAAGRVSAIARGVEAPAGLAVHGDRIVLTGTVHGHAGLWTVGPGRFDPVVQGDYGSVAFSPDGKRLVVEFEDHGFWSTTKSLCVIAAPH